MAAQYVTYTTKNCILILYSYYVHFVEPHGDQCVLVSPHLREWRRGAGSRLRQAAKVQQQRL